jgi:hypothetical protein
MQNAKKILENLSKPKSKIASNYENTQRPAKKWRFEKKS